jgi:hypothetical protein
VHARTAVANAAAEFYLRFFRSGLLTPQMRQDYLLVEAGEFSPINSGMK